MRPARTPCAWACTRAPCEARTSAALMKAAFSSLPAPTHVLCTCLRACGCQLRLERAPSAAGPDSRCVLDVPEQGDVQHGASLQRQLAHARLISCSPAPRCANRPGAPLQEWSPPRRLTARARCPTRAGAQQPGAGQLRPIDRLRPPASRTAIPERQVRPCGRLDGGGSVAAPVCRAFALPAAPGGPPRRLGPDQRGPGRAGHGGFGCTIRATVGHWKPCGEGPPSTG